MELIKIVLRGHLIPHGAKGLLLHHKNLVNVTLWEIGEEKAAEIDPHSTNKSFTLVL